MKSIAIAGFVLLAVPASLVAQENNKDKEDKEKDKSKEKVEQIIITRKGAADERTVIEIKGDKITVNGKEVKDNDRDGDVTVHRNNLTELRNMARARVATPGNFSFNMDDNHISLFSEDANRAMLGVHTETSDDEGAKIVSVVKESAAEKAGLKAGDVITRINDKKIDEENSITEVIHQNKPGDKVNITFTREGKQQKVTAELGKWKGINMPNLNMNLNNGVWAPATPAVPGQPFRSYTYSAGQPRLGLSVQDTDDGKGVKVLNVSDESNAAKAGIEEDDIITHINDQAVNSTDEVTKVIRDSKDKNSVMFKLQRDGKTQNIEVRIPRRLKTTNL